MRALVRTLTLVARQSLGPHATEVEIGALCEKLYTRGYEHLREHPGIRESELTMRDALAR